MRDPLTLAQQLQVNELRRRHRVLAKRAAAVALGLIIAGLVGLLAWGSP